VTILHASDTVVRCAVPVLASLVLPGCLVLVMAARNMDDPKGDFVANADGRLYSDYVEACYWKGQYDPSRSLCGKLVETRDAPDSVEYVYALHNQCTYSFIVDKKTRLIQSWRYIGPPGNCWTRAPESPDAGA
jgi:hypothetical protein